MIKSYGFWYLENAENNLYYSERMKKWVSKNEYLNDGDKAHFFPAVFPCHSLNAAKRHLKKHSEIPDGAKFILLSKFVGCDIRIAKK